MVAYRAKDPKAIVSLTLAFMGFGFMIILFIIGTIFFVPEHTKVLNYANSICQVDSRTYKIYQCRSRAIRYVCYAPLWGVHYSENRTVYAIVEGSRRYRSFSDAMDKAYKYQINSSYSCWYDTRNPSIAQWEQPSTLIGIILLSCGGLVVLLTVMFTFLAYQFIKKEIQKNNTIVSAYPQPYIKQ